MHLFQIITGGCSFALGADNSAAIGTACRSHCENTFRLKVTQHAVSEGFRRSIALQMKTLTKYEYIRIGEWGALV